jgi:hypothetical protein
VCDYSQPFFLDQVHVPLPVISKGQASVLVLREADRSVGGGAVVSGKPALPVD